MYSFMVGTKWENGPKDPQLSDMIETEREHADEGEYKSEAELLLWRTMRAHCSADQLEELQSCLRSLVSVELPTASETAEAALADRETTSPQKLASLLHFAAGNIQGSTRCLEWLLGVARARELLQNRACWEKSQSLPKPYVHPVIASLCYARPRGTRLLIEAGSFLAGRDKEGRGGAFWAMKLDAPGDILEAFSDALAKVLVGCTDIYGNCKCYDLLRPMAIDDARETAKLALSKGLPHIPMKFLGLFNFYTVNDALGLRDENLPLLERLLEEVRDREDAGIRYTEGHYDKERYRDFDGHAYVRSNLSLSYVFLCAIEHRSLGIAKTVLRFRGQRGHDEWDSHISCLKAPQFNEFLLLLRDELNSEEEIPVLRALVVVSSMRTPTFVRMLLATFGERIAGHLEARGSGLEEIIMGYATFSSLAELLRRLPSLLLEDAPYISLRSDFRKLLHPDEPFRRARLLRAAGAELGPSLPAFIVERRGPGTRLERDPNFEMLVDAQEGETCARCGGRLGEIEGCLWSCVCGTRGGLQGTHTRLAHFLGGLPPPDESDWEDAETAAERAAAEGAELGPEYAFPAEQFLEAFVLEKKHPLELSARLIPILNAAKGQYQGLELLRFTLRYLYLGTRDHRRAITGFLEILRAHMLPFWSSRSRAYDVYRYIALQAIENGLTEGLSVQDFTLPLRRQEGQFLPLFP